MSVLLINLRHAPDDEIAEIRALLGEHHIEFYETKANPWGISAAGIWLKNDNDKPRAKALLDDYQEQRYKEQRSEYERLKQSGQQRTFLDNLKEKPLQVVLYAAFVFIIVYFSIRPFFPSS